MASELRAVALAGIPRLRTGDDIAALIVGALRHSGLTLQSGDVLVIAQDRPKAEGRAASPSQAMHPLKCARKRWPPRWTRIRGSLN